MSYYLASRISTSNVEAMLSPRFSANSLSLVSATSDSAKLVRVFAMSECGKYVVTLGCNTYHKVMQFLVPSEHAKASGIYIIRNSVNAKVYVGSAKHLKLRFNQHLCDIKKGTHHSQRLKNFVAKYGADKLSFDLLVLCPIDELIIREQEFINSLQAASRQHGFNISPTAGSPLGTKQSAESRAKKGEKSKANWENAEYRAKIMSVLQANWDNPEVRAKQALSNKGKALTAEAKAKRKATMAARSDEEIAATKLKLQAASAGKRHTPATIEKMRQRLAAQTPEQIKAKTTKIWEARRAAALLKSPEEKAIAAAKEQAVRKANREAKKLAREGDLS